MRFVPLKTPEQVDLEALHKVRSRQVTNERRSSTKSAGFCLSEDCRFGSERQPSISSSCDPLDEIGQVIALMPSRGRLQLPSPAQMATALAVQSSKNSGRPSMDLKIETSRTTSI
jgi:hypothetical protein